MQEFACEVGAGPAVVCLNSNASSSGQWRSLTDDLSPNFRVLAPDLQGAGNGPTRPSCRGSTLGDEVTLLEPLLPNEADGIRDLAVRAGEALDADDPHEAARRVIDFWMWPGSWDATPGSRKGTIRSAIVDIGQWAHALMTDPTPLRAFATRDIPLLRMKGTNSPASSLGVATLLRAVLPRVESVEFEGVGQMGPVAHPGIVNAAIADLLAIHATA